MKVNIERSEQVWVKVHGTPLDNTRVFCFNETDVLLLFKTKFSFFNSLYFFFYKHLNPSSLYILRPKRLRKKNN